MPLLAHGGRDHSRASSAKGRERALLVVLGFACLPCLPRSLLHFRIKWALQLGESVIHDLRATLFRHWLRLDMGYFNSHAVGRLIGRLTGDAETSAWACRTFSLSVSSRRDKC
ncbi:MAG: ABC transporter transmembrane domain-containing protein [Verrucomicrobiales bacterium]